jgi:hypothetical protein
LTSIGHFILGRLIVDRMAPTAQPAGRLAADRAALKLRAFEPADNLPHEDAFHAVANNLAGCPTDE